MGIFLFLLFLILVLMGFPVAICLGISSVSTMIVYGMPLSAFPSLMYSGIGKISLLAIPFFVLAGVIMEHAGISKRLIKFALLTVGHLRGGLAIVTVMTSAFFAAISGSGPATVAALGPILIPAMEDAGYKKDWAAALVANSGNMGIIIPPSIVLVIYGVLAETSIVKLFMAGIVPGILFGIALITMALISSRNQPIKKMNKASSKEKWVAFKDAFWGLMTPVIILGGIYGGFVTPTEAAVVAVVYGLIVGVFIYKSLNIKDLWKILLKSSISSASIMFIIAFASLFAWLLTSSNLASSIATNMMSFTTNKYLILILINIILLVAGMFVDAASALYIFVPIVLPVCLSLGIDPTVVGIFFTMNLAIGMATPPIGVDLFMACNVAKVSLKDISNETIRFVIVSLIVLMMITYIPSISLSLPKLLGM